MNRYEIEKEREEKLGKAAVQYLDKLISEYEIAQKRLSAQNLESNSIVYLTQSGDLPITTEMQ